MTTWFPHAHRVKVDLYSANCVRMMQTMNHFGKNNWSAARISKKLTWYESKCANFERVLGNINTWRKNHDLDPLGRQLTELLSQVRRRIAEEREKLGGQV